MVDHYDVLRTAWKAIPDGVTGDALSEIMTTEDKLAAVRKWTVPGTKPIPAAEVRKFFITTGVLTEALFFSNEASNDLALRKLCRTVYDALIFNAFDDLDPSDPEQGPQIAAFLDGLQAAKCLSDDQRTAVLALGETQVPWLEANGYSQGINTNDTKAAGLS